MAAMRASGSLKNKNAATETRSSPHAAAETMEESIAGLQAQLAKLRDERRVRQG